MTIIVLFRLILLLATSLALVSCQMEDLELGLKALKELEDHPKLRAEIQKRIGEASKSMDKSSESVSP